MSAIGHNRRHHVRRFQTRDGRPTSAAAARDHASVRETTDVAYHLPAVGVDVQEQRFMTDDRAHESTLGTKLEGLLTPAAAALYEDVLMGPAFVPADAPERAELIDNGLARVLAATGALYALPPEAALSRALRYATERWLSAAPNFDRVLDAIASLQFHPVQPGTDAPLLLDNAVEKQQAIEALLTAARTSVWSMQPYPDWIPEEELADQEQWSRTDDEFVRRVADRCIYDERLLRFPRFRSAALSEVEHGIQIHLANWELPTFMMVVDDATAVYFAQRRGPGTITTDPGLVGLLRLSFEAAWQRSVPLRADGGLEPIHHAIHNLITSGHSTRAIAALLGLTDRTIRRRTNELIDHHQTTRAGLIRIGATTTPAPGV
jgi:hypothetical protein